MSWQIANPKPVPGAPDRRPPRRDRSAYRAAREKQIDRVAVFVLAADFVGLFSRAVQNSAVVLLELFGVNGRNDRVEMVDRFCRAPAKQALGRRVPHLHPPGVVR